MAPSPEQPLSGQGVRRISRTDGPMETTLGDAKEMVLAHNDALVDDIGLHKDVSRLVSADSANASDVDDNNACTRTSVLNSPPSNECQSSSVSTLEPFIPVKIKKRRQVFKPHPVLHRFDTLFGSDNWARFFTLKTDSHISSGVLENHLLHECPSTEMGFRLIRPNEWLVEATTKQQSDIFSDITTIAGVAVTITRHDTLNYIQGTVVLPHIQGEDLPCKNILLDSLQLRYSNIHDIEVFQIKSRRNHDLSLNIMKIKFTGQSLPQKIKILGQNREVRPYVPKPLQCNGCCRFGHSIKRCTSQEVCAVCGSQQHKTNWNCTPPCCVNCGSEHHAKCKTCEFYIYNTELKLLMTRSGMSAREAKLELRVRGLQDPARNPSYRKSLSKPTSSTIEIQDKSLITVTSPEPEPIHTVVDVVLSNKYEVLGTPDANSASHVEEDMSAEPRSKKRTMVRTPPKPKKNNSCHP